MKSVLLVLLVVSVPLAFSFQATLLKEGLTHLLAISMASLCLLSRNSPELIRGVRFVLGLPLVGLLGVSALSLLGAGFSFQGVAAFYQLLMFVLIYGMVASHLQGEAQVLRLSALMALTAFIASLVGIYQVLFPKSFHTWYAQGTAISTLANTNHVGGYLITAIPLTLSLALLSGRLVLRALFGTFAVVATFALILTEARGAWVGFAGAMVTMAALLAWGPHRGMGTVNLKRIVLIVGLGLLLALGATELLLQRRGGSILSRVATIFDPSYSTNRFRLEWWAETLEMIKDRPLLGVGIGNFALSRLPYARYVDPSPTTFLILEHPHNEYLHAAVEMGLVGLLVYLWVLFSIGRLAWKALSGARSTSSYVMAAGFTGGLTGALIHSLFFYPWHSTSSALNLWVILGLLEVLVRAQGGPAGDSKPLVGRGRGFRLPALAMVALLWLGFSWLSFKPWMADFYLQRGNLKIFFASPAEALADLQRSLAWEDFGVNASMRLGEVSFKAGKYQEAIRHFQRAVERSPGLPTTYANLGLSFYMAGHPDRAKEAYVKALKINPNFPVVHNNLGNLYSEEGRYELAVEEYKRALALNPQYANAHYNLGLVLTKAGRLDEALLAHQEAAGIDPNMAEAWYNIAALHALSDRRDEAIAALTRAVHLDPHLLAMVQKDPDFQRLRQDERFHRFLSYH